MKIITKLREIASAISQFQCPCFKLQLDKYSSPDERNKEHWNQVTQKDQVLPSPAYCNADNTTTF